MLTYFFHPAAEKELTRLPIKEQERIIVKIKELCQLNYPFKHRKVKKLRGKKLEEFRLRIGNYRIKFVMVNSQAIKIIHIQHRQVGY